tara:strand:+ start:155 stop:310 length:156 start_codon:yes stop_codon:yes gene_type:complete
MTKKLTAVQTLDRIKALISGRASGKFVAGERALNKAKNMMGGGKVHKRKKK